MDNFSKIVRFLSALLLTGCACVEGDIRDYTAHVHITNTLERQIDIDLRVEYWEYKGADKEYRYTSDEFAALEDKIIKIDTRSFEVWEEQTGGSDCPPQSKEDSPDYWHKVEFSRALLSEFTVCFVWKKNAMGGEYIVQELGSDCAFDALHIETGWENSSNS